MYQEPNAQGEETKKRAKRGPELLPIPLDGFVCVDAFAIYLADIT